MLVSQREKMLIEVMVKNWIAKLNLKNACLHFEAKCRPSVLFGLEACSDLRNFLMPIEINMRLGGAETWTMVKSVYGVDLLEEYIKIALGVDLNQDRLDKMKQNPRFVCISKNFHPETNRELNSIQFDLEKIQRNENIVQICMVRGSNNRHFGWFVWKKDFKNPNGDDNVAKSLNESLNSIKFEYC
jgi:biotin carboxylase